MNLNITEATLTYSYGIYYGAAVPLFYNAEKYISLIFTM